MITDIEKFEIIIEGILANGYGICDDFLTEEEVSKLLILNANNYNSGLFKAAGVGKKEDEKQLKLIRGDEILWLEQDSKNIDQQKLFLKINALITYLNQTCFLGIIGSEFHFSNYEKGRFYKRHRDSFQNKKGRIISVIIYLNNNWEAKDGGNLMVYPVIESIETSIDISPIAGRIVCFESEKLEHEVLQTFARRVSITGWLLNKK
ncbi:MAG: 2OG-Fe(II) oxygenase [Bacteroidota bacterium]